MATKLDTKAVITWIVKKISRCSLCPIGDFRGRSTEWSHVHTVVWECCKDDRQSQWGNGKIWPPADAKPLSVWYEGYTRAQVRVMWLPQTMKHLGSGHRDGPDHWIVSLPRYHRHSVLAFTVCATEFVWRPGHTGYWNAVATLSLTAWCFAETQYMITQRYAMAEWYGAGPAIARSWVRLPPVAAVYQRQLSVPSLWGRLMGSKPTGYGLQAKCGWSGWWYHGMSAVLRRESTVSPPTYPLSRAADGCIPRRGTTSSCQSAATYFQDCEALLFTSLLI